MIDTATVSQLAKLRTQIEQAQQTCGQTLRAMTTARQAPELAIATPFLTDCAAELEALAGICRQAAAEAGRPALLD